nr:ribosomal protein S13 [Schizostauron trachyderma]
MAYIFESELPQNKSICSALVSVFGIGKFNSHLLCYKLGFSKNLKVKHLSKEQITKLIKFIELSNLIIGIDLKKLRLLKTKKLLSIKSYKGFRLKQGLPVRGQRTHTNARTSRK